MDCGRDAKVEKEKAMPMIADQSLFIPGLLDGKGIMRSNSGRRLERNRKFADSPLEGNGFEPLVLLAAYAQVIDLMQIHLGAGAAMVQLFFFLSASNHSTEPAEARIEQVVACCASAAASACRRKSSRNRKFADSLLEGTGFELLVRGRVKLVVGRRRQRN
jgi:hypothetical protein